MTDRDAAPAAAEGADDALYEAWRAAVLEHERMCIEVDIYTPKDVYAAYLAARTREIEAALALRRAVAPFGLGVIGAARPAPAAAPREGDDAEGVEDGHFECAEWCRGGEPHCFKDQQPWPCAAAREAARGEG